ncbi:MAG: hypothetical protein QXH21_08900 [Ignisphaera sp.]
MSQNQSETEFVNVVEKLKNEIGERLNKAEQMKIRLYKVSSIDNYNGKRGREMYVYGIKVTNEELLNLVTRILRVVHDDPNINVDFIAVADDVYVQWHVDTYNEYGNYIGTTHSYEKLDDVLRKFKKIESNLPEREELIKKFKDLVNNI